MRRPFSRAAVWQHFTAALVLIGAGATGSLDIYREYALYHRLHGEAEWDWTIPDQWYDQQL
ncbi:MAG: hypothetical protein JWN03_266 [Nocardia sp.]|uniref:hypothetical protein n=1 Tax=Nocardia sp. TaxID=1821 RepID=UPI002623C3CC|nr:hypothetical protein [Nocardia sp.]MCU1639991.1 hypothetical protein [Nocardia sp.]